MKKVTLPSWGILFVATAFVGHANAFTESSGSNGFELKPKVTISFTCSEDNRKMLAFNGSSSIEIADDLIDWTSGLPTGACSPKMVEDLTRAGFFCSGHWLYKYTGEQEQFMDSESCQRALQSKPLVTWN